MKNTFKTIALISTLALSMTACSAVPATTVTEEVVITTVETALPEVTTEETVMPEIERERTVYGEDGSRTEYFYREDGSLESGKKYDENGNLALTIEVSDDGKTSYNTFCNADGKVSRISLTTTGEEIRVIEQTVFAEDGSYDFFEYYDNEIEKKKSSFDTTGRLIAEEEYNEDGRTIKISSIGSGDELCLEYEFEYNEDGTATGTEYNKDGSRNVYLFSASSKQQMVYHYDANGTLTDSIRFDYDENGNIAVTSTYDENGALSFYRINKYDANGNIIKQTRYSPDGKEMR